MNTKLIRKVSLMLVLALTFAMGYAVAGGGKNRRDAEKAYNDLHAAKERLRNIHSRSPNWENTKSNALQQMDAADQQLKAGLQGIND